MAPGAPNPGDSLRDICPRAIGEHGDTRPHAMQDGGISVPVPLWGRGDSHLRPMRTWGQLPTSHHRDICPCPIVAPGTLSPIPWRTWGQRLLSHHGGLSPCPHMAPGTPNPILHRTRGHSTPPPVGCGDNRCDPSMGTAVLVPLRLWGHPTSPRGRMSASVLVPLWGRGVTQRRPMQDMGTTGLVPSWGCLSVSHRGSGDTQPPM